jgi:hypothetical protein
VEDTQDLARVPDIYVDSVGLATGTFGFNLVLFRTQPLAPAPTPGEPVAIIRMSPEMAQGVVNLLREAIERHRDSAVSMAVEEGSIRGR